MENKVYDLIIIGGGPAGITAGIYAARFKLKTLLITKDFGGQLMEKASLIENYPGFKKISGLELIEKFKNHLLSYNVEILKEEVIKAEKKDNLFFILTKNKKVFNSKTLIVASGSEPRSLNIPGEKEYIGKGVSFCPTCDAPFFLNKTVAVIGGGNAGFEAGIFLSKYAKKIYILEYSEKVAADPTNQNKVKKDPKIEVITNAKLTEIKGEDFVKELVYQDRKSSKIIRIPVDGIFVEIGHQPATSFLNGLVDFTEKNEIKVNYETLETKTPGLFAAGDVNEGSARQIITACGEGAKAAIAAHNFLEKNEEKKIKN